MKMLSVKIDKIWESGELQFKNVNNTRVQQEMEIKSVVEMGSILTKKIEEFETFKKEYAQNLEKRFEKKLQDLKSSIEYQIQQKMTDLEYDFDQKLLLSEK